MVIGAFNFFFFLSVQTEVVLSSEFWRVPVPTMPGCRAAAIPFFELQGLRLPCAEGGGQLPIGFLKGHMQGWGWHLAESLQFRPPQAG